jgi:hypothetical protein
MLGVSVAFDAKAYYTIGLLREMVSMAGLARSNQLHLGAIFQVLDAIELIGRAIGGFRHAKFEATARLKAGLNYVLDLNGREETPLVVLAVTDYLDLRNFTGHGAASAGGPLHFDRWTGLALLHLATRALDAMWGDPVAMAGFVKCQIDSIETAVHSGQTEAIYVRDIHTHLHGARMPSEGTLFDSWRGEDILVVLATSGQTVTGS